MESAKYEFKEIKDSNKEVLWNDLPVFAVESPTGLCFFENQISLIKKHEQVINNNANTFDYNDNAKLKITGFTPRNELFIEQEKEDGSTTIVKNPDRVAEDRMIREADIFYTPNKDGDIGWITKDINDTASENHKKTCLDEALMTCGTPNVTDQGFTNADNAAAIEKKFFPLEQFLQGAHHLFKKELLRMWEIITDRVNLKKSTKFDFRDIEIILNRNLPQNNQEIVDIWLKLRGLISDKTILEHLPYDLDAEAELAEIDKQNEEAIKKNFSNMQMLENKNTSNTKFEVGKNDNKELDNKQEEKNNKKVS